MFSIPNAILLIIDVQGNLALVMHDTEKFTSRLLLCIKAAKILDIPIMHTEQVPQKLGKTIPALTVLLNNSQPIEKSTFSCWGSHEFVKHLRASGRTEIIIVGIEAHVCVFQTVADLLDNQFKVQVVTDAVSSRTDANKNVALERMRQLGAVLTSSEMLVTELMRTAEHKNFREILALIK